MVDHLGKEELHHLTARGVRAGEVCGLGLARGLCGAGARGVCGGCAVRGRGRDVRSSHSTGAWTEHALLWYVHR